MECLRDYIGIKWCKAVVPESNLYINDLPGISLKSIDSIANDEQITFLEVWNQVQNRAIRLLNTAVINEFGKRYRLNRLTAMYDLGKVVVLLSNQTAAAEEYRGFTVELACHASGLQVIHVQEVSLYLKADANVTIKAFQLLDSGLTELKSYAVTGKAGWNKVAINENYFGIQKVFIAVDAKEIESPELVLNENFPVDCCDACWSLCPCDAHVKAAKSDNPFTAITYGNNTFGLTGIVSIKCAYEQIVCGNKSMFGTALWYLLGAEMLSERIHSDRLNRYTTIDSGRARELREEFYRIYREELSAAIEGINLNTADCCLECDAPLSLQSNLP